MGPMNVASTQAAKPQYRKASPPCMWAMPNEKKAARTKRAKAMTRRTSDITCLNLDPWAAPRQGHPLEHRQAAHPLVVRPLVVYPQGPQWTRRGGQPPPGTPTTA